MSKLFRRAFAMIFLGSMLVTFTGCGKRIVGTTFVAGDGRTSVEFTSEKKADFKKNGQEIDDVDWSQSGDTITVKTKVFGDVQLKVTSDGLMYGNIPLKEKQ